jgi:DNA-binding response OmpR family regulator
LSSDTQRGPARPALLVVDDEEQILSALRRALRKEGYEIVTAGTPQVALRLLAERRFDAVLSDHKMPGMSGMQLLSRARELQPAVVLLLITGWTEEIPRDQLSEVGVRALITKPWEDARLKATLRHCLAPRAQAPSQSLSVRSSLENPAT